MPMFMFTAALDLNGLSLIDANGFSDPPGRYVAFAATAGTAYQFRVAGGWGGAGLTGPFTLGLTSTNPPVFLIQPKDCAVSPRSSRRWLSGSLNIPTDVCVAQLKQLLWGQHLAAIERRLPPSATINLEDIKPYIPLGTYGNVMPCPEYGFYSAGSTILGNPACSLHGRGHLIPNP